MRHLPLILLSLFFASACKKGSDKLVPQAPVASEEPPSLWEYVDPFVGTGGHGHTYPGATMPFGLVQLSPDTRLEGWDGCSGYHYSDSIIHGFSHTHLSGTGVSDYGDVLIMADTGSHWQPTRAYAATFDKKTEQASPGYYRVDFKDRPVAAELTATTHAGLHRYSFPENATPLLLIDLIHRDPVINSGLQVVDDDRVEGFRVSNAWAREQHIYFSLQFSRPIKSYQLHGQDSKMRAMEGKEVGAQFQFEPSKEPLLVRIGLSGTDVEGARRNLAAELPDFEFAQTLSAARETWERQLHKIEVKGGTLAQKRIFYSALYHTMIVPNLWSDVDGRYRGMDKKIHQLQPGDAQYTVFSLWDTFRTTHPLYTLIEADRTSAFLRTFIRQYQESGLLPVWELAANETNCMIGYHSVSVIADAYFKGIGGFDANLALNAMATSAHQNHLGLDAYQRQGFIGAEDEAESVSKALEYAYDDWTIGMMAAALGRKDAAVEFLQRAQSYRNHFDPETKFFRARSNGGWMPGFDPREVNFNFTEANAWQYSLFVPQDIGGLMALHGGEKGLEKHLDALFSANSQTTGREQADITGLIGQYAHGNEPSHHMAYLYTYAKAPHKTQALVRHILDSLYHAAPDGLSGNEDCGQMSAWYVMSAIGIYPVVPGSPYYTLGSPLFDEVTIHLENGKSFTITAQGNSANNAFVKEVSLNNQPWKRPWISHATILEGGNMTFQMAGQATANCYTEYDFPALHLDAPRLIPSPYVIAPGQTFGDSMTINAKPVDSGHSIRYREFSNKDNLKPWQDLAKPLVIRSSVELEFIAVSGQGEQSKPVKASFYKVDQRRRINIQSKYSNQYSAGGNTALIDQLRGGTNFRTGRWQGYNEDFLATVDLGTVQDIRRVALSCLQDIGSWIWMPSSVRFSFSENGKDFSPMPSTTHSISDKSYDSQTNEISFMPVQPLRARYVRVEAKNYGICPDWHLGAGGKTWIFIDEIVVE